MKRQVGQAVTLVVTLSLAGCGADMAQTEGPGGPGTGGTCEAPDTCGGGSRSRQSTKCNEGTCAANETCDPADGLCKLAVTVDFGASLGAVKPGLFSINDPYLSPGEVGTQGLNDQLDSMAKLNPPMLRLWNRNHPPASNPTKVFNPATDANIPYHGDMALLYKEYAKRVHVPLFFTIAQIPFGEGGYPLDNPTVRAAWIKWYTDVVVWIRSLGVDISYIALFNEGLNGNPPEKIKPYLQFYNDLADSLRAANPGVKIGGTSEAWLYHEYYIQFLQTCGAHSDFISWNQYAGGDNNTPFAESIKSGTVWYGPTSAHARWLNDTYLPARRLELAISEYSMNGWCYNWPFDHRQQRGYGAVWTFSVLYNLMINSQDFAFLWHFGNGGCFPVWGPEGDGDFMGAKPVGTLLHLLSARLRQANLFLASSSDASRVECMATATPKEYMVGLVNKTADSQTVKLNLLNYALAAKSEEWTVVAEDDTFPLPKIAGPVLSEQTVTLPPYSLRIVFAPRSDQGGDAASGDAASGDRSAGDGPARTTDAAPADAASTVSAQGGCSCSLTDPPDRSLGALLLALGLVLALAATLRRGR